MESIRNKIIEDYKNKLEKNAKLVKSLDENGLTFENQVKIIYTIPSKFLIKLLNSYNLIKI